MTDRTSTNLQRLAATFVCAAILGCAPHQPISERPAPRPLELHLADNCEKPLPGRIQLQKDPRMMPLCAERAYFADDRDFSSVSLTSDRIGAPAINLCFSQDGREKFARTIAASRGRWVVFLSNRKLLMVTKISSSETPECAMIEGAVSSEQAAALQAAINHK